jgi:hypothetical protein
MKEKMGTSRKHGGNPILKKRRAVEFIRDNKMENKEKRIRKFKSPQNYQRNPLATLTLYGNY